MSANPFSGFDPFWVFRSPLSGDVNQRITAPLFSLSLTVIGCWFSCPSDQFASRFEGLVIQHKSFRRH